MTKEPGKWVPKEWFTMPEVPDNLGIDPLLLSLIHAEAFLECSNDEAVNPDGAVEAQESIGVYLQRIPKVILRDIDRQLKLLAKYGSKNSWPEEAIEFINDYLYNAGALEEDE